MELIDELGKLWEEYGGATYDFDELEALFHAAMECPVYGTILEIGTYGGCSATALLLAARERHATVHLCDPHAWMWDSNIEARLKKTLNRFPSVSVSEHIMSSIELSRQWTEATGSRPAVAGQIDILHIDGQHEREGIEVDCREWLPRLSSKGLACFHDYKGTLNPDPFPGMTEVIDESTRGWNTVWHGGKYGLLIRRKP